MFLYIFKFLIIENKLFNKFLHQTFEFCILHLKEVDDVYHVKHALLGFKRYSQSEFRNRK